MGRLAAGVRTGAEVTLARIQAGQGAPVTYADLAAALYGPSANVDMCRDLIRVYVCQARNLLGNTPAARAQIVTHNGWGKERIGAGWAWRPHR